MKLFSKYLSNTTWRGNIRVSQFTALPVCVELSEADKISADLLPGTNAFQEGIVINLVMSISQSKSDEIRLIHYL